MEKLKNKIVWKEMGRETIDYAGRKEVIPSSIWMSEKETKNEIEKRLFGEGILQEIMDCFSISDNLEKIAVTHVSCWINYHVFCLEMGGDSYHRFALNLLPTAEKNPVFREYWEKGVKAWKETEVIPKPILLSKDGRFFVQEWVEGEPISSITGESWRKQKKKIITLICESAAKLNKIGLVFFPLLDYEIMYSKKDDRVVFLDITRLKDSGFNNAKDLFELCRKSAINNTPIGMEEFCRGVARAYSYDEFTEFVSGWELNEVNLHELWREENSDKI